jgi:outer membrane protein assembly factor BamB
MAYAAIRYPAHVLFARRPNIAVKHRFPNEEQSGVLVAIAIGDPLDCGGPPQTGPSSRGQKHEHSGHTPGSVERRLEFRHIAELPGRSGAGGGDSAHYRENYVQPCPPDSRHCQGDGTHVKGSIPPGEHRFIIMTMRTASLIVCLAAAALAGDWPDWRGPRRDGISPEKNLPARWSPTGENLAWRVPVGGRSAPVVMNNRVYLMNSIGQGATLKERVMALDADTGKTLWEHSYHVFLSDVPPHRAAWASPAADPETGNVYTFGVGGMLIGFDRTGKKLWEHSLTEEMGLVTTHGGRTVSPVIEGPYVIVSGITTGWGEQARAGHRFMAFDKKTGDIVWVSSPGGRPFDTTYSPPVVADVAGTRMIIAGGGDGTIHALKVWTGEPLWKYQISKRGVNTGVALNGTTAIVSQSEENLDTSEMGLLAAVDAKARGAIGKDAIKWRNTGWQGGFSSPVVDGDRLYQVDNGANLFAFDVNTGKTLWQQNLGTIQKASIAFGDGKIYVGSENGKFWILKPGQEKVEILSEHQLGTEQAPEAIIASVAISDGRVFLVSNEATYCIGKKQVSPSQPLKAEWAAPAGAQPAFLQVYPTELVLKPGDKTTLKVRSFDSNGRFIRDEKVDSWAVAGGLGGSVQNGVFTADSKASAGEVQAKLGNLTGTARIRVIPPLPWTDDFTSAAPGSVPAYWINAAGKSSVREMEGNKVLVKHADNPFTKRARAFIGAVNMHDYTIEVDVNASEKRRQMGDAGVVAQRYNLILFGNHQRLELESWQPETERTVKVPFQWKSNTWYRLKLTVENMKDGSVRARGKAWPVGEPEPDKWLVEKIDKDGHKQGSPGIYADAPFEVYFDNLKVAANQ